MNTPFLRISLAGGRFIGAAVPFSFFADFAAIEELIVATARYRFLSENPGRKRAPKGFARGVRLAATGISDGSAIVEIDLLDSSSELPTMPRRHHGHFEGARDDVLSTIRLASDASPVDGSGSNGAVPPALLHYFDRIGRSLAPDESMCLHSMSEGEAATLTAKVRKRLLFSSSLTTSITEEMTLRGSIPEVDQDRQSFELQLTGGRKLSGPMPEEHRETILRAFQEYRIQSKIQMDVVGILDRRQQIGGWTSIRDIVILDPLDVALQLEELRILDDGWLDGEGVKPPVAGLEWLAACFEAHYPDELPLPRIYPTPAGGAQLEWTLGSNEVGVEVDLTERIGEWHAVNLVSGEDELDSLDLKTAPGWSSLMARIRNLVGTSS